MVNVLNGITQYECNDIFIHNKVKKKNYYILFRYLVTLESSEVSLWVIVVYLQRKVPFRRKYTQADTVI